MESFVIRCIRNPDDSTSDNDDVVYISPNNMLNLSMV